MKTLDILIDALKNQEDVQAFRRLEAAILENETYQAQYKQVIEKQKTMVQKREMGAPDYKAAKADYEQTLQHLKDSPVVIQYLSLLSDINEELQMIIRMINDEINADLSDE